MSEVAWREGPLDRHHDRKSFDCGSPEINTYLHRYARQNHESGGSKCFIAAPLNNPTRVLGFYTLSPASIAFARVPILVTRGLARYEVPAFRLGRLGVDRAMQGRGLGGRLLFLAAERCMAVAQEVGGVALLIDAKDEQAARWYAEFGAIALVDAPLSLLLPFATVAAARSSKG